MTTLSNTSVTEMAIKTVILDAIAKGHTNINEMKAYMQSEVFAKAVTNYKRLIEIHVP